MIMRMEHCLTSWINESRLVTLARDLVRIPSVNPPGRERPVAEYLDRRLKEWGIETVWIKAPDPRRPQVLARLRGDGSRPPLFLNGHMDVVPPGDTSRWTFPPFSGLVQEGRLHGRGSSDMKGGLSVAMEVARALQLSGSPLAGDLVLTFAMGEETGEPGTLTLLEASGYRDGFGIVLEPTDLAVCVAEKGLAWFQVTLEGKPAHASVPEQGINPIDRFLELGPLLKKYDEKIRRRNHPLCGPAKCTMTRIHSGDKENVVPGSLTLTLDRRINPDESVSRVRREVETLLSSVLSIYSAPRVELIRVYEPAEISSRLPQVSALCHAVEQETGKKAEIQGTPFSTDVRHFIHDLGIPAVAFGPGEMDQPHTVDESIRVEDLVAATRVILNVAQALILKR